MAKGLFLGSLLALAAATLAACTSSSPVDWDAPVTRGGDALPGRLVIGRTGEPRFDVDTTMLAAPVLAGACEGSARVALSGSSGAERYVAWWAPRADSSAALVAARSTDGGQSWGAPEPIDTADHTPVGCKRPAPAIVADSASGYVHVAYSMRDADGAGVFFSHSMDHGKMFHSPVTIVYGERLAGVAIAARGDTVAVAYVDPSADHPPVGLALSHTAGHIFEERLIVPGSIDVTDPAVTLAPGRVAIAWVHRIPGGATSVVSRVGNLAGTPR